MAIGIYMIRNKLNSKVYIGKSFDIDKRFREHLRGNKTAMLLARALKKYGINNFEFLILEECSKEEISDREIFYIDLYKSRERDKGYNIAAGGNGGDTISSLPEDRYNDYINKLSKPRPDLFKIEQSIRFSGSRNPMYGKHVSDKTKSKMRDSHLGKVWVNNGLQNKLIDNTELDRYFGWNRGMLSKKSATTIESIASKKSTSE